MLPEPLASVIDDPLAWADLLALLRQRAAARVSADSLLLHRIPAALLCTDSPVAEPENGWTALAARVLRTVAPNDPWQEPTTWPARQALVPHVLVVTDTTRVPDTTDNGDVDCCWIAWPPICTPAANPRSLDPF